MSKLIDHVAEGLARLRPRALKDPRLVAVITVLLQHVQHLDDLTVELGERWSLRHDRAPLFMLQQFGALLDLPYSAAWSKALYRQLLRARALARKSRGTYDEVVALASILSAPGTVDLATVTVTHPEALSIGIPNLAPAMAGKVREILLGAIQETTELDVVGISDTEGGVVDGLWFIFGDEGPGFGDGMLA